MLEFELVYRVTSSCCPQTCQLSDFLIESNVVPYRPTLPVSQYRPLQTNVTCLTVSSLTDQRYLSHSIVPYRPTLPVSQYRPVNPGKQEQVKLVPVSVQLPEIHGFGSHHDESKNGQNKSSINFLTDLF